MFVHLQSLVSFFLILILYCYSSTVVRLLSPSLHPTPAEDPSLLHFHHPPGFHPSVLHSSSPNSLSSLAPPHATPPTFRWFPNSMSLATLGFLPFSTYYSPAKGEIIWYLSHTVWLISLNIMLSSTIHAVAKSISSFFLSAA